MFRGYYNLTSGMITQNKKLNIISNNMTNVSTPGYKQDTLISESFRDEILSRTGNKDKSSITELGDTSLMRYSQDVSTDFSQGTISDTGEEFDFALNGNGFFNIQTQDGVLYTRDGSFTLDDEGYLCLQHAGRVLGENGEIKVDSDIFRVDTDGNIYNENGNIIDKIKVSDFDNYENLTKTGEGMFQNANANEQEAEGTTVEWKKLEGSNVNSISEMVNMMSTQRAIQSASQLVKIYDQLMSKATTDIGRL